MDAKSITSCPLNKTLRNKSQHFVHCLRTKQLIIEQGMYQFCKVCRAGNNIVSTVSKAKHGGIGLVAIVCQTTAEIPPDSRSRIRNTFVSSKVSMLHAGRIPDACS